MRTGRNCDDYMLIESARETAASVVAIGNLVPGEVCTLTLVFVSSQGEQNLLTGQIRTKGGDTDRMFAVLRITPIPAGFVYSVLEMSNEDLFFVLNPFRYCLLWHRWNGLRKPFDRHYWPEIAHF